MSNILSQDEQKKLVGKVAVETLFKDGLLHNGMKLGMGTGSTVEYVIDFLATLLNEDKLKDIAVVPTSDATLYRCEELGIPTYSLNSSLIAGKVDLCIDGADRVDCNKNLIKGGGAALLREKIVAYNSTLFVVVIDEKKKAQSLNCSFALPIEVLPFAYKSVEETLKRRGLSVCLRCGNAKIGPTITDNGNYILDVHYSQNYCEFDARKEEDALNEIVGVIENGFFTKHKEIRIFVANEDGSVENY